MTTAPLVPRNADGVLRVLVIGRISTIGQQESNIQAGYDYALRYLKLIYDGPVEIKYLGERGSGMLVDRATIQRAADLIEEGWPDLVLMEDLSKAYRNPRWALAFVQDAVDKGVRVIAPGDSFDSADENCEVMLGAAALRHGLHIPDTRRRVRRTATASFHAGGMVLRVRFGYRRLSKEEAASGEFGSKGLRIARISECTPVLRAIFDRIMAGQSAEAVADWLQDQGVPTGPYVKSGVWTGAVLLSLLYDAILSGRRRFRVRIHEPVFATGKHRRRKNPNPEIADWPELAHFTVEEHDRLRECLLARRRKPTNGDRRRNVPRQRAVWPGQAVYCSACGGLMYAVGKHLKCHNSLPAAAGDCWNHVQVPQELLRHRTITWLLNYLDQFPTAREVIVDAAWQEIELRQRRKQLLEQADDASIAALEKQAANLAKAIAQGGQLDALLAEAASVDKLLKQARARRDQVIDASSTGMLSISREGIAEQLEEVLLHLARSSFEFADLLRKIFPVCTIHLVQAIDTPQVWPRAKLVFRTSALLAERPESSNEGDDEDVLVEFDVFEPSLHIRHMPRCLEYAKAHPKASLRDIAAALGINYMTVKRARDYARRMAAIGTENPFIPLNGPPANASRWRKRRRAK